MTKSLPNEFVSNTEKLDRKYGLKVAQAITNTGEGLYTLQSRLDRFHKNRKLAQGLQDPDIYKELEGDHTGQNDFKNMFWNVVNPLPKYITNATDLLTEGKYKPEASAIDQISLSEKSKEKAKLIGNLMMAQAERTIMKDVGIKLVPEGQEVPASIEEVQIHEQINMKSSVEMIAELGGNLILENNKFERLRSKSAKELVINKWAGREHYFDEHGDIRIDHIPANKLIVPFSDDEFFEKNKYTGAIKESTIGEVWINNDKYGKAYTREELFALAKQVAGQYGNSRWNDSYEVNNYNQAYNSYIVRMISFEYNTTIDHTWVSMKRKSGGKFIKKVTNEDLMTGKYGGKKYKATTLKKQVFFDGLFILGSNKILQWELRKNMAQNGDGLYDSKPLSRFAIVAPDLYEMRNRSLVEAAEYHLHQIQSVALKIQSLVSKITPAKMNVDVAALQGVIKGLGIEGGKPMDIIRIMEQIGILFTNSANANGMAPVKEIPTYMYQEFQGLVNIHNHSLQALESEIGLNDVLVGSNRDKYEGVGSKKLKMASSIRSLSDLQNGLDYLDDQSLQIVIGMLKQAIVNGDYKYIKGLKKAIGNTNVDILKIAKHETLAELGIKFKMLPNDDDIARIEMNIQREIDTQQISVENGERIIAVAKESPKQAMRLASILREEERRKRMEEAQMNAQMNGQEQQQSAALKQEMEMQKLQLKAQFDKQLEEIKSELIKDRNKDALIDSMQLEGVKHENKLEQIEHANANNLHNTTSGNSQVKQPRAY